MEFNSKYSTGWWKLNLPVIQMKETALFSDSTKKQFSQKNAIHGTIMSKSNNCETEGENITKSMVCHIEALGFKYREICLLKGTSNDDNNFAYK